MKQFLKLDQEPRADVTDEDLADLSTEDADQLVSELGLDAVVVAPAPTEAAAQEPVSSTPSVAAPEEIAKHVEGVQTGH